MGQGKRRFADDEYHWYALDVVRQKEYVAGYILNRMGCVTFIPTETRFQRKNRYTKGKLEVAHAALPGTVFVGFPSEPDWYRVNSMHLVNGVLSMDGRYHRIDTASPDWINYRAYQVDGRLALERHLVRYKGADVEKTAVLVHVQGRGVLRSPISLKVKAASNRPVVIRAAGERARILAGILSPKAEAFPQKAA